MPPLITLQSSENLFNKSAHQKRPKQAKRSTSVNKITIVVAGICHRGKFYNIERLEYDPI